MPRVDYAFPFRIAAASNQAAQAPYAAHVDQMILQTLLTSPGERADLPEFGCGIRQLLFAPNRLAAAPGVDALQTTTQLLVQRALKRWLSDHIELKSCQVTAGPDGDMSQIVVTISYLLLETQSLQQSRIVVT
jgi:phage baseplate assembly protein W